MKKALVIIQLLFCMFFNNYAKAWTPFSWTLQGTLKYRVFFLDNNHKTPNYVMGISPYEFLKPTTITISLMDSSNAIMSINNFYGEKGSWIEKYYQKLFQDSSMISDLSLDQFYIKTDSGNKPIFTYKISLDSILFNIRLKKNNLLYVSKKGKILNIFPLKSVPDSFNIPFFIYPFAFADFMDETDSIPDCIYDKPNFVSGQSYDTLVYINETPVSCTNYIVYFAIWPLSNYGSQSYIGTWQILFENKYHLPIRVERNVLSREININGSSSDTTNMNANNLWYKTFIMELEDFKR